MSWFSSGGSRFVAALAVLTAGACVEPPAATPARDAAAAPPSALATRLRRWAAGASDGADVRDARIEPAHEHDTAQVRCAWMTTARVRRVVCVSQSDEVLAGEPGFERYLALHQFDTQLAVPAARVLIELRDAMLGNGARTFTRVDAHGEPDALVIDAAGTTRTSAGVVPGRWRITIARGGATREAAGG